MSEKAASLQELFRPEALNFPKYSLNEPSAQNRLHQNEMLSLTPADREELLAELGRRMLQTDAFNTYPSLEPIQLMTAFAAALNIQPENIEVTSGSSQALTLIAEAFFAPQRKVAITSPSFSLYAHLARLYGSSVVDIALDEAFEFAPSALFSEDVLGCQVAILCTPNNPTGTALTFETIVEFADAFKGMVIIDEAYFEFFAVQGGHSCVEWAASRRNVLVLRTLSKAWAAAGLRVGAMVGHPEVISIFRALKPPYSVAWPSEVLASFILNSKQEVTSQRVAQTVEQVAALQTLLRGCSAVECLAESKANFVFFRTPRAELVEQELHKLSFLIRRYSAGRLQNCVRISMPPQEYFELLKTSLRKVLS